MKRLTLPILILLALVWPATTAAQQSHVADRAALRDAIAAKAERDVQNLATVKRVLEHPQVQEVARQHGLDVKAASSALGTLSSAELAQVAESAGAVETQLAGGQRVTLTVTTILLIVIVILLIVLIAD